MLHAVPTVSVELLLIVTFAFTLTFVIVLVMVRVLTGWLISSVVTGTLTVIAVVGVSAVRVGMATAELPLNITVPPPAFTVPPIPFALLLVKVPLFIKVPTKPLTLASLIIMPLLTRVPPAASVTVGATLHNELQSDSVVYRTLEAMFKAPPVNTTKVPFFIVVLVAMLKPHAPVLNV